MKSVWILCHNSSYFFSTAQVVIATAQIYWSKMVEEAIQARKLKELYKKLCGMLEDLVELVRGKLTKLQRMTMSALIVIEVCIVVILYWWSRNFKYPLKLYYQNSPAFKIHPIKIHPRLKSIQFFYIFFIY